MILESSKKFNIHFFMCTSCTYIENCLESDPSEGQNLRKKIKDIIKEKYPNYPIRINASGCLGQCQSGIACVIYPHNIWFRDIRPGDEEKIISKIDQLINQEDSKSP